MSKRVLSARWATRRRAYAIAKAEAQFLEAQRAECALLGQAIDTKRNKSPMTLNERLIYERGYKAGYMAASYRVLKSKKVA